MAQIDLLLASGDMATGLLFIGLDDASLIFELAPGLAESAAGQTPDARLLDLLSKIADALNRANPGEDSFAIGGVTTLESPDALGEALLGLGDDQLAELSYNLTLPNIIEGRVVHVLPLDFMVKLAGLVSSEGSAPAPPPPPSTARPPSRPIEPQRPRDEPSMTDLDGFDFGTASARLGASSDLGGLGGGFGPSEPTVRAAQFGPLPGEPHAEQGPSNLDLLMDVSLNVTVELGRTAMAIKDILALGPGSVIELDKLAGEPVDILVNDRPIAKGEVVVVDENFGVRVTEIISPSKRVASLR
jgi:flagellar motor switch protein FliN/FliY